jgi:hypothetical protein
LPALPGFCWVAAWPRSASRPSRCSSARSSPPLSPPCTARGSCVRWAARLGPEGRLAVDNIARSPRRTATTSNALLIGVFLVTLVTVAGSNLKDDTVAKINSLGSADYLLESKGGSIDPTLVRKFEAIKEVNRYRGQRPRASARIDLRLPHQGRRRPAHDERRHRAHRHRQHAVAGDHRATP